MITLRTLLEKIEEDEKLKDQYIYIGSHTSFFCIEKMDVIREELAKIEESMYSGAMKDLENHLRALTTHKKALADIKAERQIMEEEYKNSKPKRTIAEIEDARCTLNKREGDTMRFIKRTASEIPELVDYIRNFRSFLDRKVEETWLKDAIEPNGVGIKIEGTETGGYWLYSEYVNGKNKNTTKKSRKKEN